MGEQVEGLSKAAACWHLAQGDVFGHSACV